VGKTASAVERYEAVGPRGHQFFKRLNLGKGFEPAPLSDHFRGVKAVVLELAG
jgi:hypothetical protein